MPPQAERTKLTYDDYVLFPEDGRRHELIDGDHFMTPAPSTRHQEVLQNILYFFQQQLRRTHAGRVFVAPTDVVLSETDVVQPDLLFVATEHAAVILEKHVKGLPDLVVEVVSESTRKTDASIKRKLYERAGVREYWIVDPELESVQVYRLTGTRYERLPDLSKEEGESLSTPLLSGFALPLADVFP